MLSIGTLKSFNSTDYRAEVQLAGSIAAYLDNIPVARNIASDQMIAGRHVIVAIPGDNPKDACVIAVWDAAAGGGGAANFLALTDTPSSYAGHAGEIPKVNDSPDALQFIDLPYLIFERLNLWNHFAWAISDYFTDYTSGSATITKYIHLLTLRTQSTSGSKACVYVTLPFWLNLDQAARRWRLLCQAHLRRDSVADNETWFGFVTNPTAPTLTERHIAWRVLHGDIYASCGNGTNGTQTDTGVDLGIGSTNERSFKIITYSDKIEYYIDGILEATLTTNLAGSGDLKLTFFCKNLSAADKGAGFGIPDVFCSPE